MSLIYQVTDSSFDQFLSAAQQPVLLSCLMSWDEKATGVKGVLEDIAQEYASEIKLAWLEIDECPALVARYAVEVYPTYFLIGSQGIKPLAVDPVRSSRTLLAMNLETALGDYR